MKTKSTKKYLLNLLICAVMVFGFAPRATAQAPDSREGLCRHHTRHTPDCGYSRGTAGSPCGHRHTEDCYILQTNCPHLHDENCYPGQTLPDSSAPADILPEKCTHICSEDSGCVTKNLNCTHIHDETCGYAEEAEAAPCSFNCTVCSQAAEEADVSLQTLNTAAVLKNRDGTDTQYATLKEAVENAPSDREVTIEIVRDMTITEAIRIENKKIRLTAARPHTITFDIPADAENKNGFQAAGHSKPASLVIGENITVTAASDTMRSIVNVGGRQGQFSLEGGTLSSGSADLAKAIVCVDNGGTFSMSAGKIQGDKNHDSRGVLLQDTDGQKMEFTMTGGTITDCSLYDTNLWGANGAGVLMIGSSKFTMTDGKITNCSAVGRGGGVAVVDKATFTISGGTIDNCSSGYGGNVYTGTDASYIIDGAVKIGDQSFLSLKAAVDSVAEGESDITTIEIVKDITIEEQLDIGERKIKLTASQPRTITFKASGDPSKFNCFRVAGHSKTAFLAIGENITVTAASDKMRSIVNIGGRQGQFSLEGGTLSSGSADLAKAIVCVDNGGTFSMSAGRIQGDKNHDSRGVFLQDTATNGQKMEFTMTGGTIADCSLRDTSLWGANGAGVLMIGSSKFTMTDGEITNCSAVGRGGGAAVFEDTLFTMKGGKISGCTASKGGGVTAQANATFILKGGEISGCEATALGSVGGGVYLSEKNVNFTMSGGKVCHNTAEYLGGGIYTESDGTISAGAVRDNKTTCPTGYGGGIYVHKEATLKLTNAVITQNTASALGGGIWSCRTGDIKIYVREGGGVFANNAQGADSTKTPRQAGDDIASTVTFPAEGFLYISPRMPGGGENCYYEDGAVIGFTAVGLAHHHNEGPGLGAPDGKTQRYSRANSSPVTERYITRAVALKNVVSEDDGTAAKNAAKVVISGNSASRGGGIGTNGNLIIGLPAVGSLTVEKEVSGSQGDKDREFHFTVALNDSSVNGVYGDMNFVGGVAEITLKDGEKATAAGLPAGTRYTVTEKEANAEGYTTSAAGERGTVPEGGNAEAKFTNHREIKPNDPAPTPTPTPKPDEPKPTPTTENPTTPTAPNSPDTGDGADTGLYTTLLATSSLALAVTLVLRRKSAK